MRDLLVSNYKQKIYFNDILLHEMCSFTHKRTALGSFPNLAKSTRKYLDSVRVGKYLPSYTIQWD